MGQESSRSIEEFWIELGVTQKDIAVPLASLYSHNIKIIDDDVQDCLHT